MGHDAIAGVFRVVLERIDYTKGNHFQDIFDLFKLFVVFDRNPIFTGYAIDAGATNEWWAAYEAILAHLRNIPAPTPVIDMNTETKVDKTKNGWRKNKKKTVEEPSTSLPTTSTPVYVPINTYQPMLDAVDAFLTKMRTYCASLFQKSSKEEENTTWKHNAPTTSASSSVSRPIMAFEQHSAPILEHMRSRSNSLERKNSDSTSLESTDLSVVVKNAEVKKPPPRPLRSPPKFNVASQIPEASNENDGKKISPKAMAVLGMNDKNV